MIIDIHTHIGVSWKRVFHNLFPSSQAANDLVLKMEKSGIDFAVVFPFETTLYDDPRIYERNIHLGLTEFPYKLENEILLLQVEAVGKGKLLPFLAIDPKRKVRAQIVQLEKLVSQHQVLGLKIHTQATFSKATDLIGSPFIDFVRRHELPLLFHTHTSEHANPVYVLELALRYPDINMCAAHFGGFIKEFYEKIDKENPGNLFIDCSPLLVCSKLTPLAAKKRGFEILPLDYNNPRNVIFEMAKHYPDRLMFGSDEPFSTYINPRIDYFPPVFSDLKENVGILKTLPKATLEKVTFTNAKRFLGKKFKSRLI